MHSIEEDAAGSISRNRTVNPAMRERTGLFGKCIPAVLALVVSAWGASQPARAAEFVLVNQSGVIIDELFISPCGKRHWGPNQLAGTAVMSTRAFSIANIDPGCYDIMVILPVGHECIMAGASLPQGRGLAWTISKSTLTQALFGDCSQAPNIVVGGRRPWQGPERRRWQAPEQ
jgi:hypothetical protein